MSEMTTRQRASSILSAAKMRMLEDAGITVISREEWHKNQLDRMRMEKLERLYEAEKRKAQAVSAMMHLENVETPCTHCEGKGVHHGFGEDGHDPDYCVVCGGDGLDHSEMNMADQAFHDADDDIEEILAELG